MSFTNSLQKQSAEVITNTESTDPFVLTSSHLNCISRKEEKNIEAPRASSLYDSCIRMHVLCTKLKRKQVQYLNCADIITFDIGNALHYWCQNTPNIFGNNRYGFWRCRACKSVTPFSAPQTSKCASCGADEKSFEYYEFGEAIKNPYYFSFHIDMFRKINSKIVVTEIKTIDKKYYETLVAPLVQHEYQVNVYMIGCYYSGLYKNVENFDYKNAYIYYICKTKTTTLPVKTFKIKLDKNILISLKEKLTQYKKGIENYPDCLPLRNSNCVTKNFECWGAKMCPVLKECKRYD